MTAEDGKANAEPSMEEILASIRRIISEENVPADAAAEDDHPEDAPLAEADSQPDPFAPFLEAQVTPPVFDVPEPVASPPVAPASLPEDEDDDVLELTDIIEEPVLPPPIVAPVEPSPPPVSAKIAASAASAPSGDYLLTDPAALSSAAALSSLSDAIERARPQTMLPLGQGVRTLEDMVMEMMRPMLSDWLNQNLPHMVERMVEREIQRVARRAAGD
jgi:uncharacterized protein